MSATISDGDQEEFDMKVVSTIRFSPSPDVKFSILNETLPPGVMEKVRESMNVKVIDKQIVLEERVLLIVLEGTDISDHLYVFNRLTTQLLILSMETKIDEEDQALLLLTLLPPSYDSTLVTTLLVGAETLKLEDVKTILLETEKVKEPTNNSEVLVLMVNFDSSRGRSWSHDQGRLNLQAIQATA